MDPVLSAVRGEGYEVPTPIQAESIPALLAGRDLLGIAQTGTGKTAAFALPLIQRLLADPRKASPKGSRVLVVAPTRELAAQIEASFAAYGRGANLTVACVFGGVGSTPQEKALARGVDVLVATPGRLLDLVERGHLTLGKVESVVLDEADRMFDMGFIRDVRRIVALLPKLRQTIFFSAPMPPEIAAFADPLLTDPVRAAVASTQPTADKIDQKVLFVSKEDKRHLLAAILKEDGFKRVIVFTKTKHGANRLVKQLATEGIAADAIHANKSQNARTRTMDAFRNGGVDVLVATDLAARGIDVDDIELVVNFDLPNESETYIHRIGRTARAGAEGVAVSFCDAEERPLLRDIERLVGFRIPVELDHPYRLDIEPIREIEPAAARRPRAAFSAASGQNRPRNDRGAIGGGNPRPAAGPRRGGTEGQGDRQPLTAESRLGLSDGRGYGFRRGPVGDGRRREEYRDNSYARRSRPPSGRGGFRETPSYNPEPSIAELFSGAANAGPQGGDRGRSERMHGGPRASSHAAPHGAPNGGRDGAQHGGFGRPRPADGGQRRPRTGEHAQGDPAKARPAGSAQDPAGGSNGSGGRRRRRRGGRGRRPDAAPTGAE